MKNIVFVILFAFNFSCAQNIGIGTETPTSKLQVVGSQSGTVNIIMATTLLNDTYYKILVNNGALAITITLSDALTCIGRVYFISRYAGSTGTITIARTGTNNIQALVGTIGASSSIGIHSTAGLGLNHSFTAVNISGVGVWVRI